jgi:hypothetical protein
MTRQSVCAIPCSLLPAKQYIFPLPDLLAQRGCPIGLMLFVRRMI